jgi:MATE family multidrug resistance protein
MQLLTLALPIIGMTVSRMLMGFIDFVMVSQLGTVAQAAISPATIIVFAVACPGMGVANGVQTFVSQADGRGESRLCGAYGWQTIYIALAAALVTWPLAETTPVWYGWITALAEREPAMAALEVEYTRIAVWSVPLAVLSIGFNGFFMGVQRTRVVLLAVLLSLVVNATGNYLLIFGKLGFPEMGIAGAAVATVIGWAVRAGFLAGALLLPAIDRRYNTRRALAFSWRRLWQLIYVGGPTAVQWLVDIGSWVVFLAMIMPPYGTYAAAASNVGLQYMHLSFMPAIGIGLALCSQVGFAIGEGRQDKAVAQTRVAMRVTGIYMGSIGLLFVVGGYPLMRLLSKDPQVINAGVLVLIGAAAFQVFDAMCITYMNALRGAGDTRWPAVVTFACCWGVFIGGGVAVGRVLPQAGLLGPWVMCAAYIIALGLLLRRRWRAGPWRRIRLFEGPTVAGATVVGGVEAPGAVASD